MAENVAVFVGRPPITRVAFPPIGGGGQPGHRGERRRQPNERSGGNYRGAAGDHNCGGDQVPDRRWYVKGRGLSRKRDRDDPHHSVRPYRANRSQRPEHPN